MGAEQEPRMPGRWLKWALGVSLALNLVVVGMVAGAAYRLGGPNGERRHLDRAPTSYGAALARALPREARRELRRSLRADDAGLPDRAERRALFTQMIALLRDETFDREAAQALLDAQADAAVRMQTHAQGGWLNIVSEMDLEARRTMAFELEEALRRGPKGRKPRQ